MTLALQQSKTASDTREKLRLNFHSLSLSVSELLEYGRKYLKVNEKDQFLLNFMSQQMHVL